MNALKILRILFGNPTLVATDAHELSNLMDRHRRSKDSSKLVRKEIKNINRLINRGVRAGHIFTVYAVSGHVSSIQLQEILNNLSLRGYVVNVSQNDNWVLHIYWDSTVYPPTVKGDTRS